MRDLSTIIKVLLASAIILPCLFLHSMFREVEPPKTQELVGEKPLDMTRTLADFSAFIQEHGQDMRDSWGVDHRPATLVQPNAFLDLRHQAIVLNGALAHLQEGRLSPARTPLSRYYNVYNKQVKPRRRDQKDIIPAEEEGKLLYGLYRYNRGVLLSSFALRNSRERSGAADLLRQSLNDYRRAVAAFEQLGEVRNVHGTYWGPGAHAWEGFALEEAHGALPVAHVYTNLALSYLRLGKQGKYPFKDFNYLQREYKKYSWGEDELLTPIVNDLIKFALSPKGKKMSLRTYRLVMALHNMEAAGRGREVSSGQDIYYYTVGLLLNHIADDPSVGVGRNRAVDFFQMARNRANPEQPIFHLASKELALIFLGDNRLEEATTMMASIDIGRLEDALYGPQVAADRLFLDMLQIVPLQQGRLEAVLAHFDKRSRRLDPAQTQAHAQIMAMLGKGFYAQLHTRLEDQSAASHGSYLSEVAHKQLPTLPEPLAEACQDELFDAVNTMPTTWINLQFHHNPHWFGKVKGIALAGLLLLALYLLWCYLSHRKMARRFFESRYGEELEPI